VSAAFIFDSALTFPAKSCGTTQNMAADEQQRSCQKSDDVD
jgi:hypothetical protein